MLFDTLKRKNKAEQEEQEWNANRPADYVSQNKEAMDALTGQIGSGYDGSELAKAYQQYRDQTADTAAAAADTPASSWLTRMPVPAMYRLSVRRPSMSARPMPYHTA